MAFATATGVATAISAVSAAVALLSLLAYFRSLRTTEHSAARDEALALAEMRRQMVIELRRRIEVLEQALADARAERRGVPASSCRKRRRRRPRRRR
jgi:hypothetical protein